MNEIYKEWAEKYYGFKIETEMNISLSPIDAFNFAEYYHKKQLLLYNVVWQSEV